MSFWLGTIFSSAATVFVAIAIFAAISDGPLGAVPPFSPPLTKTNALFDVTLSGLAMINQCCQSVRLTSVLVRQFCDFKSTMYVVTPLARIVLTTSHLYAGSGD